MTRKEDHKDTLENWKDVNERDYNSGLGRVFKIQKYCPCVAHIAK